MHVYKELGVYIFRELCVIIKYVACYLRRQYASIHMSILHTLIYFKI